MTHADSLHALIVEDEMIIAMELEALLADLGFRTFDVAPTTSAAVSSVRLRRPDLVTLDLRIVGGSGTEALAAIRESVGPVPHIYVTANADLIRGRTGCPVVAKPIQAHAFAKACREARADWLT
jgi:CheY-like chemotaxis protein